MIFCRIGGFLKSDETTSSPNNAAFEKQIF